MNFNKLGLLLIACLIIINEAKSQDVSIGAGLGLSTYWGDLNSGEIFKDLRNSSGIQGQILAIYQPSTFFSLRANVAFGKFMADDALSSKDWQRDRNLSFQSHIMDFSGRIMLHPWSWQINHGSMVITPFASSGLSVFKFDPITRYNGELYRLQPLGTEGQGLPGFDKKYSLTQLSIPVGGGIKFQLSERFSVILESYAHKTFTDYIDDVGAKYVNYFTLLNGSGLLTAQLSDRTPEARGLSEPLDRVTGSAKGGKFGDYYFFTDVTFTYKLSSGGKRNVSNYKGSGVICPSKSVSFLKQ